MYVYLRYMLLGGAVNLGMLHAGRFLTGLAGGMTAASIPVSSYDYKRSYPHFVSVLNIGNKTAFAVVDRNVSAFLPLIFSQS